MALLYLDSSAFLRRVFGADGADTVDALSARFIADGGRVVSGRLLWLEARRVTVRERQLGNDILAAVEANLASVDRLPLTDDVWNAAHAIETHVKTLDSLHLATCSVVDAHLLSFDAQMLAAASALGIPLAS